MDSYFFTFVCLLILQMSMILVFLSPSNDVRKITAYINNIWAKNREYCVISIFVYFVLVLYLGMYTPLIGVFKLISNNKYNENEKRIIVSNVEKIYIMAGFSLFLFVVSRGIRALTSYAAKLLDSIYSISSCDTRKKQKKGYVTDNINILPGLLRIKRSVSQNEITTNRGLKEQLMKILQKTELLENNNNFDLNLQLERSACSAKGAHSRERTSARPPLGPPPRYRRMAPARSAREAHARAAAARESSSCTAAGPHCRQAHPSPPEPPIPGPEPRTEHSFK
ncbi:uncharacterized protein [Battus philenor]|uniref:uncharacterized protein n=1 Tax=Battus philenor TaxID=42288 RepID=UPI0035CF33F1